jgi:Family of unknown function (DUF6152)
MEAGMCRVRQRVTRSWWTLVLCGVAILCAPLLAHHSFAVYYIEADTIEVEGDIIEFQYKNPHAWIHIVGRDPFGKPQTYSAEWTSTSQLERAGITKETLRVGDNVHIWASPNKNPIDNRIRLKRIERPADGWKWGQQGRQNRQ